MRRLWSSTIVLGVLLLGGPAAAGAPPHREAFEQANEAYWRGDLQAAMSGYQALTRDGVHNADVYFNWGNAAAEAKALGVAIWAYEQALLLRPSDEDALHNLERVRAAALDAGLAEGGGDRKTILPGQDDLGTGIFTAFSPRAVCGAFLAAWIGLFAFLLGVRRVRDGGRRTALTFAAVLFALASTGTGGLLAGRILVVNQAHYGVVVEAAPVRAGPGAQYRSIARVLAGVKVRVRGGDHRWRQVTLPDGSGGWLEQAQVRPLRRP